jgi:hypothetical protein
VIEPAAAEPVEAAETPTLEAEAAGRDNPLLLWQLFFPAVTRYEGENLSEALEQRLRDTSAATTNRVRVVRGSRGLRYGDLDGYAGAVILGSRGSRRRLRKAGFEHVYRYLALPGIENPRWLLPVEQAHAAAVATLPRMYKYSSRLLRLGLISALKLGTTPWRSRIITVAARREPAIVTATAPLFPGHRVRLSFASGTPGPMRKPTLVCLDRGGRATGYGKVATSEVSEALVRNESLILRAISGASRLLPLAPRLLLEASCDGRTTVVANTLGGAPIAARFGRAQRQFFAALQGDLVEPVARNPFLARLARSLSGHGEEPAAGLLDAARTVLAGVELPRTLMHGDATPWNMRRRQGAIAAFDWEYGVIDGLPVLDELHYRWQTRFLLEHRRIEAILRELDAASRGRFGLDDEQAAAMVDVYIVHALVHRLGMGCGDDDELVAAYREALTLRLAGREKHR